MLRYQVSCPNPASRWLRITLDLEYDGKEPLDLQLPIWRPGRYEVAHYAGRIRGIRAIGASGNRLPVRKNGRSSWRVEAAPGVVAVSYAFHAGLWDAGGTFIDDELFLLNPINCLMFSEKLRNSPCELTLKLENYQHRACQLPQNGNLFEAKSYDELADSPLIASDNLKSHSFRAEEVELELHSVGQYPISLPKLEEDIREMVAAHKAVFQEFQPDFGRYSFLFYFPEETKYHGVEHRNSTLIVLGGKANQKEEVLLSVASHELFHFWNAKRIRPYELSPYDYTRENYFRTGYVIEGLTTYYGDLLNMRAGLLAWDDYRAQLERYINRHLQNFGRNHCSLTEASFDLWVDGYRNEAPNRKVSIYTEGALAALILDLNIRHYSENIRSLDDVLRALWQRYGREEKGYTEEDYRRTCEEVAEMELNDYFQEVIEGRGYIEAWLIEALPFAGLQMQEEPARSPFEGRFGIRFSSRHKTRIAALDPNSPAYEVLQEDDEVESVNGDEPRQVSQQTLQQADALSLLVWRRGHQHRFEVAASQRPCFRRICLTEQNNPDPLRTALRQQWLGPPKAQQ